MQPDRTEPLAEGTASSGGFTGRSYAAPPASAKACKTCKTTKALVEFPPHHGSKDGRRLHCRVCLTSRRYQPKLETPAQRLRRIERQATPAWRRSHSEALRGYGNRNPLRTAATRDLNTAVNAGRVQRAERCQVAECSSRKAIEAHHWSYAPEHRLDVLWACAGHHRQGHAKGYIVPAAGIPAHYGTIPEAGNSIAFRASSIQQQKGNPND